MGQHQSQKEAVHAIWIGNRLSLLEQLAVKLFQRQGYQFHLWLYEHCEGVPEGTIVGDAAEVVPRSSLFRYEGKLQAALTNGGIGSLAHWSDQFQLKLLYEHGGIYTQLDVTPLVPLPLRSEHVFVGVPGSFQTCFMRCPKGSAWALDTYEMLCRKINVTAMPNVSWLDSMDAVGQSVLDHGLADSVIGPPFFTNGFSFKRITPPRKSGMIHWWNSAAADTKSNPIPGSYYVQLLAKVGLIPDSGIRWTIRRMRSILGELKRDYVHSRRMPQTDSVRDRTKYRGGARRYLVR